MAEELDLHLLELARAEGEVSWCDLVAKALADLADAKRDPHTAAIDDVLEVDKDALRRLWTQEGDALLTPQGAEGGLEHQVELAGLGQRVERLGVRPKDLLGGIEFVDRQRFFADASACRRPCCAA